MQSTFEHNAQRAAVKAVEDRLAHNDRVRKQASQRRTIGNLGAWLVGILVLAAIGYWFSQQVGGGDSSFRSLWKSVSGVFMCASDSPEAQEHNVRQDHAQSDDHSVKIRPSKKDGAQGKRNDDRKAAPKRNVKPIGNR